MCSNRYPGSHNVEFQIPHNLGLCLDISDTEDLSINMNQTQLEPEVGGLDDRESYCNNLDRENELTDEFYNSTIDDLSNSDDPDACVQSCDSDDDKSQNTDEEDLEETSDNKSEKDWEICTTHYQHIRVSVDNITQNMKHDLKKFVNNLKAALKEKKATIHYKSRDSISEETEIFVVFDGVF